MKGLFDVGNAACPAGEDEALNKVEGAGRKTVVPGNGVWKGSIHVLDQGKLRFPDGWNKSKMRPYVMRWDGVFSGMSEGGWAPWLTGMSSAMLYPEFLAISTMVSQVSKETDGILERNHR